MKYSLHLGYVSQHLIWSLIWEIFRDSVSSNCPGAIDSLFHLIHREENQGGSMDSNCLGMRDFVKNCKKLEDASRLWPGRGKKMNKWNQCACCVQIRSNRRRIAGTATWIILTIFVTKGLTNDERSLPRVRAKDFHREGIHDWVAWHKVVPLLDLWNDKRWSVWLSLNAFDISHPHS